MEKIKAVIFDWGGVLIEDPAPALYQYCANAMGVRLEQYIEAFEVCIDDFQSGKVTEKQFWKNMAKHLNVPEPQKNSLWTEAFLEAYKPRPMMFDLAARLQRGGCKTAVLSNTEQPVVDIINHQNYREFDEAILSCVEGIAKPGKEIYLLALDRLGVEAKEAVFIDDKKPNIEGAIKVGLNTIYFTNLDNFKKDIAFFFPKIV